MSENPFPGMIRRIGGQRAKAFGSLFEDIFSQSCRSNCVAFTRIPDSCRRVSRTRLIQIKSPFDWIITYKGATAFLDTKTVNGERFSHSAINMDQVRELLPHEVQGHVSGYLIWFRPIDKICFYKASLLNEVSTRVGSLSVEQAHIQCGSHFVFDPKVLFMERELRSEELIP